MALETDFTGKTALITGAASGIGAACAHCLDQQGVGKLILIDRAERGLAALNFNCETALHIGDVSDPTFWELLQPQLPALDHAIISAGIAAGKPIVESEFADWRAIMSVNLDGAFLSLRSAMRAMPNGGSIVLLSSVSGLKPMAGSAAYGSSKAAITHLTKVAALEGSSSSIRVNAIAPGGVDTPIWDGTPEFDAMAAEMGRDQAIKTMASATPSGRFATAPEIAKSIGFLLSGNADNITGAILASDGGFSL